MCVCVCVGEWKSASAHKLKLNGICAPRVLDDGTHNMRLSKIIKSNCLAVEKLNGTHNRHIVCRISYLIPLILTAAQQMRLIPKFP